MANVYIEPRPKGRPEGNPTDDYVVEDRADHVLTTYTLYFVIRCREFRKFLAGAFFVSAGIQFYLYLTNVSVPLLGTSLVFTPEIRKHRPHLRS